MRRFAVVLALGLCALTAQADDLTAQAEALLGAGIDAAVPVEAFAALGPDVVPALIAIFERDGAPRHIRLRALGVLAALDDARAAARLEALVRDAAGAPASERFEHTGLVLRRALDGLRARAQGSLRVAQLAPLLEHRDPHVRTRVVELLARQPAARASLEARLPREASASVQAALRSALAELDGAPLTGRSARRPAPRLVRPESVPRPR
jgi:hypothetical protein